MDPKNTHIRLYILGAIFLVVLLVYVGILYDVQVNQYDYYLAQSVRSIAQEERVEASRGTVTDRNGQVLVSSRPSYSLTFDSSLLQEDDNASEAVFRLLELCQSRGISWEDNLPISDEAPFLYTVDALSDLQKGRFLTYLQSLEPAREILETYLSRHPETLELPAEETEEDASQETDAADSDTEETSSKALVDQLTSAHLTENLLLNAGLSPSRLVALMREDLEVPADFSAADARLVLGVQYELEIRKLVSTTTYVLADDIDTEMISLLNDGAYAGAKVIRSSVREYQTEYAAHILGYVNRIGPDEWKELQSQGYGMNDWVGKEGVELAFEEYLKGTDGWRVVSTNEEGKITGEFYSQEPQPGSTVELTIDLDLQQVVEEALAETVSQMTAADGNTTRGAGAVVLSVDNAAVLALASYPTYNLSTWRQEINELSTNPASPMYNRATQGTYAPGSTLKPLTAVAALETGTTTLTEEINDTGHWLYPGSRDFGTWCWKRSGHGLLNITEAITNSCNYFFAEMGYRMGMDTLVEYLQAFGLGSSTGIEIGDASGKLPENPPGEDQAPWAAYGQSTQAYTPLQLANYIVTLINGGEHREVHLLKAVKSYDNSQVLAVGNSDPINTVEISDSTLEAVKEGMLGYTQPGGQLYSYFTQCVVTAGAKTGTAQLGDNSKNNGVFVCFAPYDDPEIVLAMVIEKGDAGANLASTAVKILNAYFTADEIGTAVIGENQLLQ